MGIEGTPLELLPDGSLLASGRKPEKDTYEITGPIPAGKITAIRLVVLPHESLPMRGPGRCDNGNLHLSEFEVWVAETGPGKSARLKIARATADFNQAGWDITDGPISGFSASSSSASSAAESSAKTSGSYLILLV